MLTVSGKLGRERPASSAERHDPQAVGQGCKIAALFTARDRKAKAGEPPLTVLQGVAAAQDGRNQRFDLAHHYGVTSVYNRLHHDHPINAQRSLPRNTEVTKRPLSLSRIA